MTLEETRFQRFLLDEELTRLVQEYEQKTGMHVYNVHHSTDITSAVDGRYTKTLSVKTTVSL